MASKKTALTLALGSAIAASMVAQTAAAADNPFAAQSLTKGYMVAEAAEAKCGANKAGEAKCGSNKSTEAQCGAAKKAAEDAAAKQKMMKEGKCGEGMCGAKKAKEGKCGEGKCGGK